MEREIEVPNQTILPPMFLANKTSLTPEEQQLVATWALKTHVIAQYRQRPVRPVTREQRQWLYTNKSPFPKSRVWLAAFVPDEPHYVWGRTHNFELFTPAVTEVAGADVFDGEMMTLCIGYLVLQTFKWSGPVSEFNIGLSAETSQFVLPIWPASSLVLPWPPSIVLDTKTSLSNFSDAFVNTGPPPAQP